MNQKYRDDIGVTTSKTSTQPEIKPLVVHLDEDILLRIRGMSDRKNKDYQALVKEFIVEGLSREEEREGLLGRPSSYRGDHDTGLIQRVKEIYTDGGCRGNPGPGGWAAIVYEGPKPKEISGAEKNTTNQRMELRAAIEGLRYLKDPSRVRLYSDSAYLLNAMKEGWLVRWEQNGWNKADKKPLKNADLWQELLKLSRFHEVEWVKVKGHSGNPGNERCHALVQVAVTKKRWSQ